MLPPGENQIMERGQLLRSARSTYTAVGFRADRVRPVLGVGRYAAILSRPIG